MEYTVKNCPKCNGELHIPPNLKTCICMFCGESFDPQNTDVADISEDSLQTKEADYRNALDYISGLVNNYVELLPKFTKANYAASFEQYVQSSITILQPAERYASLSEENIEKVAEEITGALIEFIDENIAEVKGGLIKSSKGKLIDQYRFFLTVYTIPMICYLKYSISEPLADRIIEKWRLEYPEYAFNKGSYEMLAGGFERKGFCFITTAVCETMEKTDNCNELTALRKFRDTHMQRTKKSRALVEEYYQIAPVIVAAIDLRPGCKEKYECIWREYLQPCLEDIKENRLDQCEKHYISMMWDLKKEYYIIKV